MNRSEEIITVKSFAVYLIAFGLTLLLIILTTALNKSYEFVFYLTIILTIVFIAISFLNYVMTIISSLLFNDINFYWRSLGVSLFISLLLSGFLYFIIKGVGIFFGILFFVFFEFPRFGLITEHIKNSTDNKFTMFVRKNYLNFIFSFIFLTFSLLVLNFYTLSFWKIQLTLFLNVLIVSIAFFLAKRFNSKNEVKKIIKILVIEGLVLSIVILLNISLNIMEWLKNTLQ